MALLLVISLVRWDYLGRRERDRLVLQFERGALIDFVEGESTAERRYEFPLPDGSLGWVEETAPWAGSCDFSMKFESGELYPGFSTDDYAGRWVAREGDTIYVMARGGLMPMRTTLHAFDLTQREWQLVGQADIWIY